MIDGERVGGKARMHQGRNNKGDDHLARDSTKADAGQFPEKHALPKVSPVEQTDFYARHGRSASLPTPYASKTKQNKTNKTKTHTKTQPVKMTSPGNSLDTSKPSPPCLYRSAENEGSLPSPSDKKDAT